MEILQFFCKYKTVLKNKLKQILNLKNFINLKKNLS